MRYAAYQRTQYETEARTREEVTKSAQKAALTRKIAHAKQSLRMLGAEREECLRRGNEVLVERITLEIHGWTKDIEALEGAKEILHPAQPDPEPPAPEPHRPSSPLEWELKARAAREALDYRAKLEEEDPEVIVALLNVRVRAWHNKRLAQLRVEHGLSDLLRKRA